MNNILIDAIGQDDDIDTEISEMWQARHGEDRDPISADTQLTEVEENEFDDLVEEIAPQPTLPPDLRDSRNHAIRMARLSGHQVFYPGSPQVDFVDVTREAERAARSAELMAQNEQFEKSGGRWADERRDDKPKKIRKAVPSDLKILAAEIGASPEALMYPRHIRDLPWKRKAKLIRVVQKNYLAFKTLPKTEQAGATQATYPAAKFWNEKIFSPKLRPPTRGGCVAGTTQTVYIGNELQPVLTGIQPPPTGVSPGLIASTEWMRAAEAHELPGVLTKCQLTGDSLILKTGKRFRTWRVGPNIQGMGLRGARMAVDAAAIVAGIVEGEVQGAPELVQQLAQDGDAWAILALHTKHPTWEKTARFLIELRDRLYYQVDEKDVRDSQRINGKIWDSLKAAYPEYYK